MAANVFSIADCQPQSCAITTAFKSLCSRLCTIAYWSCHMCISNCTTHLPFALRCLKNSPPQLYSSTKYTQSSSWKDANRCTTKGKFISFKTSLSALRCSVCKHSLCHCDLACCTAANGEKLLHETFVSVHILKSLLVSAVMGMAGCTYMYAYLLILDDICLGEGLDGTYAASCNMRC